MMMPSRPTPYLIIAHPHAFRGRARAAPTPRRAVGGRALWPDSRGVGHFSKIPQAQPRYAIQKAWVAPKRLVRHDPTTPQRLALDHRREHLLGQRGLGFEEEIWR